MAEETEDTQEEKREQEDREAKVASLEARINEMAKTVAESNALVSDLRSELSISAGDTKEAADRAAALITSMDSQVSDLKATIELREGEALVLRTDVDNLSQEVQAVNQDLADILINLRQTFTTGQATELRSVETRFMLAGMQGFKGIAVDMVANASIAIVGQGERYSKPFDIYDIGKDSSGNQVFKIADNRGKIGAVWIRGNVKTVSDPVSTNLVYASDHWSSKTITAAGFVYLAFERATASVTIELETSLPSGDDNTLIWPLWYIGWDGTGSQINTGSVLDMRNVYNLQGMV